jgi:hypothetical protein
MGDIAANGGFSAPVGQQVVKIGHERGILSNIEHIFYMRFSIALERIIAGKDVSRKLYNEHSGIKIFGLLRIYIAAWKKN